MRDKKSSDISLPDLPVRQCVPELRATLRKGHAVLTAEPGSGKTTLIPLLLLDEPWLEGKKILMLEPRRPAARMAARRMSALLGEKPGSTVGFQVRFERCVSDDTRIEVLTEGLLLRRLQADPELSGVGLIIFDEFHERNLQGDLSLALSLDVANGLRDDLRLLVMSASLETGVLLEKMPATRVSAAGRCHEVEVVQGATDADMRDPVPACLSAVQDALQAGEGDLLVFLPGRREIERLREAIGQRWGNTLQVDVLYGDLPAKVQDAVLRPGKRDARRVILSTDIAETSLTIEGISAVVDSGLARRPVFDPNTGLTRLSTRWISKASALQRAGRAGRLGPGHCFRAWTEARHARLDDWTAAEICQAELSGLVLELANWGVTDPATLTWIDPPPQAAWDQAADLLRQLGALDERGRISRTGQAMARIPAHPRLAHLVVATGASDEPGLATDIAALLSERDPMRRGPGVMADAALSTRLDALKRLRAGGKAPHGFDRGALRQIDRVAQQLRRFEPTRPGNQAGRPEVGRCIALAYPDRVAMRSPGEAHRFLMRNGRAAVLDETDALCNREFLAVADVDAGRREGRIRLAAPLTSADLFALFEPAMARRREVRWDDKKGDVVARAMVRLGALTLQDDAVPLAPGDPVTETLLDEVRRQGLGRFFKGGDTLRARVQLMRSAQPEDAWPDYSDSGLLDSLERWLSPWLKDGQGARQLKSLDFEEMLKADLGWANTQRLDGLLPTHYTTPAGTRRRFSYEQEVPSLAVPLQEMLGEAEGPVLAQGRVAPVLHLLSPAGRPLQLTRDLAGFWAGAYSEVKKEMRGRYPKHYWPDDPLNAEATRFTKRRMPKN